MLVTFALIVCIWLPVTCFVSFPIIVVVTLVLVISISDPSSCSQRSPCTSLASAPTVPLTATGVAIAPNVNDPGLGSVSSVPGSATARPTFVFPSNTAAIFYSLPVFPIRCQRRFCLALLSRFFRDKLAVDVHSAVWCAQENITILGMQRNHRAAGLVGLFDHRHLQLFRSGEHDRFLPLLVDHVDAVAAFGHDSLHIVRADVATPEIFSRRLVHSVPDAAQDNRFFHVSIAEAHYNFIPDLG